MIIISKLSEDEMHFIMMQYSKYISPTAIVRDHFIKFNIWTEVENKSHSFLKIWKNFNELSPTWAFPLT